MASVCLLLSIFSLTAGDGMKVREYNFTSFNADKPNITPTLLKNTPNEFQRHPEFGILPYKAGCSECVELLQKRDYFSRYFIDPNSSGHFYVQESYFPLHFRDKSGAFRTIDPRLRPVAGKQNFYSASSQPSPTFYDNNKHETAVTSGDFVFTFNNKVSMYFLDESGNQQQPAPADFKNNSIGESGVLTKNAWNKIDMQQIFDVSSVKTNFIINEPLNIPSNSKWVVFEDVISLPGSMTLKKTNGKIHEGYWMGDLEIRKENSNDVIKYKRPIYYDRYGTGIYGIYDIEKIESNYRIKTLVPVDWLNNPTINYPIFIDPVVLSGRDSTGKFLYYYPPDTVTRGAYFAFTRSPQSCDYTLIVNVPGKTELFDAYVDVEYKNSDSLNCATVTSTHPQLYCNFTDVSMEIMGPCTTTNQLMCDTTNVSPYLGTCTTDPRKVPGAGALRYANFVHCVKPQCPDYIIPFTLKNRTFQCSETCNHKCAFGSFFAVTVEGRTIENVVHSEDKGRVLTIYDTICAGSPVDLVSFPDYGVPPYTHYLWTPSGLTDSVSRVYPETTTMYVGTAFDTCENSANDTVWVNVVPSPNADSGRDTSLCDGNPPLILGGNPTGSPGSAYIWTANPPSAISFLSSTTAANPQVVIPQGSIGSYTFTVEVIGTRCSRFDSLTITIVPIPSPVIVADTNRVCEGESITLSTTPAFAGYQWSNGGTTSTIMISDSALYSVTVTDTVGCQGVSSNTFQATILEPLSFEVYPQDSAMDFGNSATLRASIDLLSSPVDSFYWSPGLYTTCTDCPNPIVTPPSNQEYTLTVHSADGCISSESLLIRVILPDAYAIPTAFSPNQDGANDQFYILKASGVTVKEFKVFNRWGQIVHDGLEPWDGSFKDELQPIGVYTFLFVLQLFEGQTVKEAGSVTLVR